ncbi:MAG: hypothetical protein HYR84_01185 [Planctomycetes bacterium]|nr:hypothetical protein [Planctomycetota bacterium]
MTAFIKKLVPIVRGDPRFAYEAYEFVFHGLEHTQKLLGRDEAADPQDVSFHVSSRQLVEGICDLARQEFGLMARVVFRMWGVHTTGDLGEIVFNLIDAELMSRTSDDNRADFDDLFDLDEALVHGFRIVLEEE